MYENTLVEGFTEEELTGFQLCLAEEYREIDQEALEMMLYETLASMTPEDAESFLKTLKKVGKAVAPVVGQALPAVGAGIGTLVGGPVGTVVGGAVGKFGAKALAGTTKQVPASKNTKPVKVGGRSPRRRKRQVSPSIAATQLLQLIQSPQFLQALASLVMGAQGRKSVNVKSGESLNSVPTGAFLNLVESLANQAVMETVQNESVIPSYLEDANGEALCDLANPDERARVLMERLQEDETFYQEDFDEDEDDESDDEVLNWLEEAGMIEEPIF